MIEWIVVAALVVLIWIQFEKGLTLKQMRRALEGISDSRLIEIKDEIHAMRGEVHLIRNRIDDLQSRGRKRAPLQSERDLNRGL